MLSLIVQTVKYRLKSTNAAGQSRADAGGSRDAIRRRLLASEQLAAALHEAGASRYQLADNHVLFEADEMVGLAFDSGFRQHARGFLEACGSQEAVGVEGGLGDAEQDGLRRSRLAAFGQDTSVGVGVDEAVNEIVRQHLGVA